MPASKMRSRPQVYPRLAFHIVRTIAFISATIVSGILIYFCVQLRHDGFKLPWTFIIVLASTLLSLLSLFVTGILYTCFFLSPLFSLILNVTILILYIVGYGLLTWNIYGTLGHTCSRANWASDDGMMICRTYKAFYAFELFGVLAQIALIVLDVRSRHAQTKLGRYNKMADAAAKGGADVKLDDLHSRSLSESQSQSQSRAVSERDPLGHGHADSQDSVPYGIGDYNDSRARLRDNAAADMGYGHAPAVRMDDFRNDGPTGGYTAYRPPQTGYANNGYGYGPQR
ncbi:hypothetical protein G647_09170 [Cladophialophora carrionii CBS 160.54]|uniref:MARVEL domain-containing protein n=1 Tax=Cladophialophora carrionii CBS 160.54 TaxID=1279043 RepID=V9CZ72_9EURO|nr:uncharacterized protein G647_09170 [Cladophialophora carrionii CBS 160.54]ETI19338.1 hypothetical protein G647_09170 [Cladophialophora carrionii CBS 160.54]